MTNEHWMAEVEQPMSGSRRLLIVGVVVLVLIGVWAVFAYVGNKKMERNYQDLMAEVQETLSTYLLDHYEGAEAIEWQGVGVEYLATELIRPPQYYAPTVVSTGRVYVNKTDYFTIEVGLDLIGEYDNHAKRYVPNGLLTPANMDKVVSGQLRDKLEDLSPNDRRVFDGFVKSDRGSPGAEVTYNVDILSSVGFGRERFSWFRTGQVRADIPPNTRPRLLRVGADRARHGGGAR